jgi:hypothetical protein
LVFLTPPDINIGLAAVPCQLVKAGGVAINGLTRFIGFGVPQNVRGTSVAL